MKKVQLSNTGLEVTEFRNTHDGTLTGKIEPRHPGRRTRD